MMKKNRSRLLQVIGIIALAGLFVLAISSCTRSVQEAQPGVTEPTPTVGGQTQPEGDDVMKQIEMIATQTAMAMGGTPVISGPTVLPPAQETPAAPGASPAAPAETAAAPVAEQPTATLSAPPPPQPTQAPVVAVPTATPGTPNSYTIHGGEFVYCIARRFNVNPAELLSLNGLGQNSQVNAGMVLKIPQTGNPFPGNRALSPHPTTYSVDAGETIYSIACKFGDVDPNAIAFANGLSEPYQVSAGQVLQIP